MLIISESGLYSLVISSRKPEARAFRKWITSEVIPSIRKTGTYGQPASVAALLENPQALRQLVIEWAAWKARGDAGISPTVTFCV
jgi:prophage antirepressor-like protein